MNRRNHATGILCLILLISFVLVILPGCSSQDRAGGDADSGQEKKIRVISTIFASYDMARVVGGDRADVKMLLPPGTEVHSYEPTPQDILEIQHCDLLIHGGGESERWVEKMLSSLAEADGPAERKTLSLIRCVEAVAEERVEGMEADAEEEGAQQEKADAEQAYDEHVWTAPKNAGIIAEKITEALCHADPEGAAGYQERSKAYLRRLDRIDKAFQAVVDQGRRKTVIFGDRFPFRYLTEAYGLTYFAAFPGCSAETEAGAATMKFLIDKIRREKIPVVFHIELSGGKAARAIGDETGAKVRLLHSGHNISKEEMADGRSFLDLMEANVDALREALG